MATSETSRSSPFRFFTSSSSSKKSTDRSSNDKKGKGKSPSKSKTTPSKKQLHKHEHDYSPMLSVDDDPDSLIESLQAIGDDQPKVARSIPKNSKPVRQEDNSLKDCLYGKEVYDEMLCDSLRMCDLLQSHLNECMNTVRCRSPEGSKTSSIENDGDSGRGASSPSSPPLSLSSSNPRHL